MINHILELDLQPPFTGADVRKAYLRLVKKHPPARDPEKFRRLNEAYEALADDRQRIRNELYWAYDFSDPMRPLTELESALVSRGFPVTLDSLFEAEGLSREVER